MTEVYAVKSQNQREQIEALLLDMDKANDTGRLYADIWKVGVNVGIRIGDLLALTMDQVRAIDPETAELRIVEEKPDRPRVITFNPTAMSIMRRRLLDNPTDLYLFQSRSPKNSKRLPPKPINSRSVCRVFQRIGQSVNPKVKLGTHSMRKTRGYAMHKAGRPIEEICKALGHSNPSVTMRYIGLDAEAVRRSFLEFEL